MIRRIKVLPVPATLEVDLGPNTGRADLLWKTGVLGGLSIEVKAKVVNRLLSVIVRIVAPQHWASAEHAEIRRECLGGSRLVGEEVVDNGTTIDARETAVGPLEVQVWEPVVGLVLLDRDRGTLAAPQQLCRGLWSKVATTDHRVNVASDSARVHDRIKTLSCDKTGTHEPVCVNGRAHGQRQVGGQSFGGSDHFQDSKRMRIEKKNVLLVVRGR